MLFRDPCARLIPGVLTDLIPVLNEVVEESLSLAALTMGYPCVDKRRPLVIFSMNSDFSRLKGMLPEASG